MPKAAKNTDEEKPVMDVNKPGKKAPDATSRPIIVSRKVLVKDDTVKEVDAPVPGAPDLDEKDSQVKKIVAKKTSEVTLKPTAESKKDEATDIPKDELPEKVDQEKVEEKTEAPKEEELKEQSSEGPKSDAEKELDEKSKDLSDKKGQDKQEDSKKPDDANDKESEEKVTVNETDPIVDELAKQALGKRQKEEQEKQHKAQEAKVQKLIEEKKYFLPVGQVTRRRNNQRMFLVLLLVIVLSLVFLNFAADAEIIKLPVAPFTNVL